MVLVYLVVYSLPAFNAELSLYAQKNINVIQWFCWIFFVLDVVIGIAFAKSKKNYVKSHILEIIAILVPFLRPLRLLRFISVGALVIQRISIGRQLGITVKLAIATLFLSYIAAIEITQIERISPDGNIKNISDGLWWALTTVTTVGYGDTYPTTTQGRFLSLGLMLLGISLLGAVSATLAAYFVRMMQKEDEITNSK